MIRPKPFLSRFPTIDRWKWVKLGQYHFEMLHSLSGYLETTGSRPLGLPNKKAPAKAEDFLLWSDGDLTRRLTKAEPR